MEKRTLVECRHASHFPAGPRPRGLPAHHAPRRRWRNPRRGALGEDPVRAERCNHLRRKRQRQRQRERVTVRTIMICG